MGVLFFAHSFDSPSHLWMRRHEEILRSHISVMVSDTDAQIPSDRKYRRVRIEGRSLLRRILSRSTYLGRTFPYELDCRKLISLFKKDDVSVIYLNFLTVAVKYARALKSTDKPVFVHCHGYDVTWDLRYQIPGKLGEPIHSDSYVKDVLDLPDNVQFIANSMATAQRLDDIGIGRERVHLKYMGVPRSETTKQHHDKPSVNILFLGRLVDCKGPDLVIRAFECACDKGLVGDLFLAGDGFLNLMCFVQQRRSKYKERIHLLGAVSESQGHVLRMDADIFTAHNCMGPVSHQEEAFGVSIAEAMSAGLPVISAKSGSLPELIEDGSQGILVEPGDIDAHANAFLRLAKDSSLRQTMGDAGVETIRNKFSLKIEKARLLEILNT